VSRDHFLVPWLAKSAVPAAIAVRDRAPLATVVHTAFDSASRKRGLLGRTSLDPAEALVIAPCSAIHTFSMKFPIDVIFVARDGRVVKTRAAIPRGRMSAAIGAFAVIEMAVGEIDRAGVRVGDRLVVTTAGA
jgi:uncharacterized membrane protein (UPF0127 family)